MFKVPYPDYEEFEEGEIAARRNKPKRKRKVEKEEVEEEEGGEEAAKVEGEQEVGERGAEGDDSKRHKIGVSKWRVPINPISEDNLAPSGEADVGPVMFLPPKVL